MRTRFIITYLLPAVIAGAIVTTTAADDPMESATTDELVQRGEELYMLPVSCWVCHGENGEGLVGPSLLYGPTAADIYDQIQSNPQMGMLEKELKLTDEDLVAIALYMRKLAKLPIDEALPAELYKSLAQIKALKSEEVEYPKSERDLAVEKIESFATVLSTWQRKAKLGSLARSYEVRVVQTFPPGEPIFKPEKGKTYFYENVGYSSNPSLMHEGFVNAKSSQFVIGDAQTKEIIVSKELPVHLRSAVHTTMVSPDGKWIYIVSSKEGGIDDKATLRTSATVIKADALTLQPVKQFTIGGRFHHGQVFRDKYLLIDTFARDPDGLDIMLFDPETDTILGGVRDEELGGATYTAWTDDEFIYVLMEPTGYAPGSATGMTAIRDFYRGKLTTMRPFWIARIDPETWEVLQEYPFPGFRGNWITFDSKKEFMYVTGAGTSNISKINISTGEIAWAAGTGIGPYGCGLNADESEIWIADKGEGTGHLGRTITVLDTATGRILETLFSGYKVDHVLLSPNGKEMWATSNGEGRIFVFDAVSREQIKVIDMPQFGDPHGLVWVHYDEDGNSRVIRDQGGFHNGINPFKGMPLE
ncbi:MAG: c-type cytochrome [Proteobacteria bacterium]|nr:c-type cytochrome [Pseudomonadota bacterium]